MKNYVLMLVPEGEEGEPFAPEKIIKLPEGTYAIDIKAHWSVTEGRKFRGGTASLKIDPEKS